MPSASSSSGIGESAGNGGVMPAASYSCAFSSALYALWSASMTTKLPEIECTASLRGVYRSGIDSALKASPSLSSERMRSVLPAMATIPAPGPSGRPLAQGGGKRALA